MPLLTITENLGSGGLTIARQVAEKLNLNLYDDDRLQKEAAEMGIRAEDIIKSIDVFEPGVARISGMILAPDDETRITEIVGQVTGISSVRSEIVRMPMGYV